MVRFTGNTIDEDHVYVDVTYTQSGNSSTISWTIGWAFRVPSPTDRDLDLGWLDMDGARRWTNANPYNVGGGTGNRDLALASGSFTVDHGSDGRRSIGISASITPWQRAASTISTTLTLPRIPKVPSSPGTPAVGAVTTSSVALTWSAPSDDGGSGLTGYQVQYATDAAFTTGLGAQSFGGSSGTVTGLTPGPTYYFRVRAQNGVGYGGYSGSVSTTPALPAPTLTGWAQNTAGELVATWSAPSVTTGLTGYRLTVASNATFTADVINIDVGVVLTTAVPGLAGGRRYWAKVAARTAGGINTYSSSRDVILVLDAGDLDGWVRVGTKPAAISYFTAEGIRRGTVGAAQALYLESLATGAASLAADTFGMQRTLTDLIVGASYRVTASMTGRFTATPDATQGRAYRLVGDGVEGDSAALVGASDTVELPEVEFVASASTVTVRIELADALTIAGEQLEVERVAFHGIAVAVLDTDYPQRLRDTVYESNLANHFDLACNSVGASWYVAKDGVTRFALPGAALPVSAVFSDERADGVLEYVDITAGYDTLNMINRIQATNYGAEDGVEANDAVVVDNPDSQAVYGVAEARLDVNLYDEEPYDNAFQDRLAALIEAHDAPELFVAAVRWNAQQNLAMAAALEIGQRVHVYYRGALQDSQIVSLVHDIQPRRWMITAALQKL